MPAISKRRDYAMPSVGFCEKSNGKCCLLSGGPAERDSQSLPQLLVEHKINRKASSTWRRFSSMFWKMSPGIWVACCRAVPTVAKVKLEPRSSPLCFKQEILEMASLYGSFHRCNVTAHYMFARLVWLVESVWRWILKIQNSFSGFPL